MGCPVFITALDPSVCRSSLSVEVEGRGATADVKAELGLWERLPSAAESESCDGLLNLPRLSLLATFLNNEHNI